MAGGDVEVLRGEIVSIGTEILLGSITDTNAAYLASQLPGVGIGCYRVTAVGDNLERLTSVLREAVQRSDVVIMTGGLGPTEDDLTREAIAALLGEKMTVDPTLERDLRAWFAGRGVAMPERNLKQATLVPSAQALPNPRGTAPGWWVEHKGKVLVTMPGVPREMFRMWEEEVVPRFRALLRDRSAVIHSRTIKTFGMSEALVDERLGELLHGTNPTIGVYAKVDGIHIRVTARARTEAEAASLIKPVEEAAIQLMGVHVWGFDKDTMEGNVQALFTKRGLTLATMESCTGGLLADMLTDAPGASRYFKGGFVTYTNEMKMATGVPEEVLREHGAVSAQCAIAMADAARRRLGAAVGVGITGVAGPDPLEGKPPGLAYVAISDEQDHKVRQGTFPAQRQDLKLRVARTALFEVRGWALARMEG
jgi:nicotinamide-nucleotide amidase